MRQQPGQRGGSKHNRSGRRTKLVSMPPAIGSGFPACSWVGNMNERRAPAALVPQRLRNLCGRRSRGGSRGLYPPRPRRLPCVTSFRPASVRRTLSPRSSIQPRFTATAIASFVSLVEVGRQYPPTGLAIRRGIQCPHQETGGPFALVDHEPTTPLGVTRLPGGNLAFRPNVGPATQRWSRKP